MGNLLDRFKKFAGKSVSVMQSTPDIFAPADVDHTRTELKIAGKAEQNGKQNIPASDAQNPDSIELSIKSHFLEIINKYKTAYDLQLEVYKKRIATYTSLLDLQQIATELEAKFGNMDAAQIKETDLLFDDEEHLRNMAREVRNFRKDNKLKRRLPDVPNSYTRAYLMLTVFAFVELIINFFLLQGSGQQYETLTHSLLYVFINVLIPFFILAEVMRFVTHLRFEWQVIGWLAVIFYFFYTLSLNLMMGHYRNIIMDLSSKMNSQAVDMDFFAAYFNKANLAFESFVNSPFGIEGTFAWYLFAAGIGLSYGALREGWISDDKYPGYGRQYRRYMYLFDSYVEAVEETIEEFTEQRDEAIGEINGMKTSLNNEHMSLPGIQETASGLKERCLEALKGLDNGYSILISEYREKNSSHRTDPEPNYFAQIEDLEKPPLRDFEVDSVKNPKDVINELEKRSNKVNELFGEMISKLESSKDAVDQSFPFKVETDHGEK